MALEKLRSSIVVSVVILFLCYWWWTVRLTQMNNRDDILTTNVEVNIMEPSSFTKFQNSNTENIDEQKISKVQSRERFHHTVPKIMLDLYKKSSESGEVIQKVDIVKSVMPKITASLALTPEIMKQIGQGKCHLLMFDVPVPVSGEYLHLAELRIPTVATENTSNSKLSIEKVIKVFLLVNNSQLLELDKHHIFQQKDGHFTFNVTAGLYLQKRICRKMRTCTARLVTCILNTSIFHKLHNIDIALMSAAKEPDLQPLLLLSYTTRKMVKQPSKTNVRLKRSLVDIEDYEEETNHVWDDDIIMSGAISLKKAKRHRNSCRRRPLYIDFAEIHYDTWIVAPHGYEAFQCLGKCFYPIGEHLSPTKHGIIQTLLHSISPSKVSRACCVPTRLESISILYVDENNVLTYRFSYDDMVVAECGCR